MVTGELLVAVGGRASRPLWGKWPSRQSAQVIKRIWDNLY